MDQPSPQLSAHTVPPADVEADWLIVGTFEAEALPASLADLDARVGGLFTRLRRSGDLTGKAGELVPLLGVTGLAARRILAVGLGKRSDLDRANLHDAAATAARHATAKGTSRFTFVLPDGVPPATTALAAGVGLMQGCTGPGLRKSTPARFAPKELWLLAAPGTSTDDLRPAVRRAAVEGRAVALARELVNLPPCDLDPDAFARRAKAEAAEVGVECEIFEEARLETERMGALLGVARGSDRPPRLAVLRYRGGGNGRVLGLVGKGVTFDSGGLSLKSNEQMLDMKCDMAGAAAVLGAVQAAAALRLPVNLLGVLALVENMPSGRSLKLGDVLRASSGKTIEVLNTDAEGRLILADALTYAVDQKASHLVDLATLTGSCMIALGNAVAGMMTNNESWGERVLAATRRAGERAWPLPMYPLYDEMLKSQVADVKNAPGTRYGGAIAAAKFLEQFVGTVPWAHLDIAGPAWADHESATADAGGTGFGVRALVELAHNYGI